MTTNIRIVVALAASIGMTHAIAQAPPSNVVDLDTAKPKTSASTITGNLIGGSSQTANQKTGSTAGGANSTAPGAIGSSVKNPLGAKSGIGVVGGPGSGSSNKAADKEDTSSSTDVQVKIPLKK